jgi:hypothetical protein
LRHIALMREEVVLAETDPLGDLIHSVIEYVIGVLPFVLMLRLRSMSG